MPEIELKPCPFCGGAAEIVDVYIPISTFKNMIKTEIDSLVKHGEWISDDYGYYHCSECGYEQAERESVTPYCANCGAIMEDDERYDET